MNLFENAEAFAEAFEQAVGGNKGAYDALCADLQYKLRPYLRDVCRKHGEEVGGDAWTAAVGRLRALCDIDNDELTTKQVRSPRSWIFGACKQAAGHLVRSIERAPDPVFVGVEEIDDVASIEADLRVDLREAEVRDAIKRLEPGEQELIIKSFYEGKTQREIAEECGIYASQVNARMAAALARLRVVLMTE